MNILITWITWFVWKNLSIFLKQKWYNIYWIVRNNSDKEQLIQNNINYFVYNNNDYELENYLKINKIDWIIHLATIYLINNDIKDIENIINTNITFWTKVLEIASNIWIKWFLNTSTFIQNYENRDYSPQNLYAATKQAFEDIWKYYSESWKINFLSLSLVNTYWKWDVRKKIFNIWDEIWKNKNILDSTSWEQFIDILYIDDVIYAYYELLKQLKIDSNILNWKKFIISSWEIIKLKDLSLIFEKISWKKLNINWWWIAHRNREIMYPYNIWENIPWWKPKITLENWLKKFLDK